MKNAGEMKTDTGNRNDNYGRKTEREINYERK